MICTWCKEEKGDRFYRRSPPRKTLQSGCIDCRNKYSSEWDRVNKDKRAASFKKYCTANKEKRQKLAFNHKWKYTGIDMTHNRYNELLEIQNHSCAICKISVSELRRRLDVDHNHKTGLTRGLLCTKCNALVVMVLENYSHLLPVASEYLKKHEYANTANV